MASSDGQAVISTGVIMRVILEMDMVKCFGLMEVTIRESGSKASSMGKDKFTCLNRDTNEDCSRIM